MTAPASEVATLIGVIAKNSDKYGYPHLIGFMDDSGIYGLHEATAEMAMEYIKKHGLEESEKCISAIYLDAAPRLRVQ